MQVLLQLGILTCALSLACADCGGKGQELYGDIDKLTPTGRKKGGVPESDKQAGLDIADLNKYRKKIVRVAKELCIQTAVIAAIMSRETRAGRLVEDAKPPGYGDNGNGFGLMQCDIKTSGLDCEKCCWDRICHIRMMTKFLISLIKQVQNKHKTWTLHQQLQGGVAAYNFGVKNVKTWPGLDVGSTDGDYSNDVIARAKYLRNLAKDPFK